MRFLAVAALLALAMAAPVAARSVNVNVDVEVPSHHVAPHHEAGAPHVHEHFLPIMEPIPIEGFKVDDAADGDVTAPTDTTPSPDTDVAPSVPAPETPAPEPTPVPAPADPTPAPAEPAKPSKPSKVLPAKDHSHPSNSRLIRNKILNKLNGVVKPTAKPKKCDELKSEIEAKIKANKVPHYALTVVATADAPAAIAAGTAADPKNPMKEVGSCEGGSHKILYQRLAH